MATGKQSYPDTLQMTGRIGTHEDAINGMYKRTADKKGEKKEKIRLFYEKNQQQGDDAKEDQNKVLLCYGDQAWAEKKEKPIKGWMIGWWQEAPALEEGAGPEKRLFVCARCPIGDQGGATTFLWEVRNGEGEFESDKDTQLVVGSKPEEPKLLLLADQTNLHPDLKKTPLNLSSELGLGPQSPLHAQAAQMSAAAAFQAQMSPFGPYGGMPGFGAFGAMPGFAPQPKQKGKKKKGKQAAGASPTGQLRAEAPSFVPGGGSLPFSFPGMGMAPMGFPGMTPLGASLSDIAHRNSQTSINPRYMSEEEAKNPTPKAKPPPPEPPKKVIRDGLTCTDTSVEWDLGHVKDKLTACKKNEGVECPKFVFKLDGTHSQEMSLTFFPFGYSMSSPGCVAVMLECPKGTRMKFKIFAGSQRSGAKVLMGNRFHVDFAAASVFRQGEDEEKKEDIAQVLRFDDLVVGIELLGWI